MSSTTILRATTADGLILSGMLTTPTIPSDICVVHVHGMSGSTVFNSFYNAMHSRYSGQGIGYLVGENRGANGVTTFPRVDGRTALVGNAFEIFEECVHDVEAWVGCALKLGFRRIILQGHSLGCSKVVFAVSRLKPEQAAVVSGLVLLSPADMLGLVEEPGCQPLHHRLLAEAKSKRGEELLSELLWGYALLSARTYLNFFSPFSNAAIFNFLNPAYGYEQLKQIGLPVLAMTGTKDDGISPACDPARAMEVLRANLAASSRVETVVFDGADHDFVGFDEAILDKTIPFIKALAPQLS